MKKILLLLLTIPMWGFGQTSDLLISEYGEGSGGNKKYIEIYNGTGATVDLANFQIWRNSNGSAWNATILALSGNLLNGETYVVANNATDVIGANLYNTFISFNGDDATGLAKFNGTSYVIIDVVGELVDPGTGWEVAGLANATVDKIITRKPTVCSPNTDWTASRGTNATNSEWIIAVDPYNATTQTTNLGMHTSNCIATCNTLSTISPSVCVTYTVPSGDETYTASGTYMDTIPNTAMCDSIITINLTINPIYTGVAASQTICSGQTYTFGTQTLTTAGTYTETFQSSAGCDSTVNLTLTVVANFTSSPSATICAGESYVLGTQTLTMSGTYTETFQSVAGCDSIVTLTLTVNPTAMSTISVTVCDSYTSPSQNYTWTTSGTYMDTIPATNLCDSVITINLTIGTSDLITTTISACDSYTFEGTAYTMSGTYDVMFLNAAGCDSIQQLVLTISTAPAAPTASADQTLCSPDLPTALTVQTGSGGPSLIISGIADCPLPGGLPKVLTFYAINAIPDLSLYGFGSANNGGGTDGQEYTFPAISLTAGQEFIIATDSAAYASFFGGAIPSAYENSAANVNGDDAIELFFNGVVIDLYGQIDVDGTGQPWEYLDGWAYRNSGSQPNNGVFNISEWTLSGINVFDNQSTNATSPTPFPISTFTTGSSSLTYEWYGDAALSNLLASGTSFATGQTAGSEDYFVVANSNGCLSTPAIVNITINAAPTVALTLPVSATCVNYAPFALTGGTPAGGVYSGPGVTAGMFNPTSAGLGTKTITYTFTANGCVGTATATIAVNACASIDGLNNSFVSVFPNPTTGLLTVNQENAELLTIELIDLTGKVVLRNTVSNTSNTIDISRLESGSYFLNVESQSGIQRMTIVKN